MTLQSEDREARIAETLHHAPLQPIQPITATCDTDRAARIYAEEMARLGGDEAYAWHAVEEAFGHWLATMRPMNAMILRAALNSLRAFACREDNS